jgi:hypothetical protein
LRHTYNTDRHEIHGRGTATQEVETVMSNSAIGVAPVCLEVNTECVIATFSTQPVWRRPQK